MGELWFVSSERVKVCEEQRSINVDKWGTGPIRDSVSRRLCWPMSDIMCWRSALARLLPFSHEHSSLFRQFLKGTEAAG